MTFYDWIPGISTSVLLGFVLWLSRTLIFTRLTKSIQHEFDEKIEGVRSELRRSEELYKVELRAKELQIEALRSGALASMVTRQAIIDKRRITAAEQLWHGMQSLAKGKYVSSCLSHYNIEAALKESESNKKFRELLIATCGKASEVVSTFINVKSAQLYVSPISWALYSAYQSIITCDIIRLTMLQNGLNKPKYIKEKNVSDLVKAALPHYSSYVDEYGSAGFYDLLDELESRLLEEIQKMIQGVEADQGTVMQAAEIMKAVNKVQSSVDDARFPSDDA